MINPTTLYESKFWAAKKTDKRQVHAAEIQMLRIIVAPLDWKESGISYCGTSYRKAEK